MKKVSDLYKENNARVHDLIRAALELHGWVVTHAAADLGVCESTLRKLIVRHGLEAEHARRGYGRGEAPRKKL